MNAAPQYSDSARAWQRARDFLNPLGNELRAAECAMPIELIAAHFEHERNPVARCYPLAVTFARDYGALFGGRVRVLVVDIPMRGNFVLTHALAAIGDSTLYDPTCKRFYDRDRYFAVSGARVIVCSCS
jgi:hypothetical protein